MLGIGIAGPAGAGTAFSERAIGLPAVTGGSPHIDTFAIHEVDSPSYGLAGAAAWGMVAFETATRARPEFDEPSGLADVDGSLADGGCPLMLIGHCLDLSSARPSPDDGLVEVGHQIDGFARPAGATSSLAADAAPVIAGRGATGEFELRAQPLWLEDRLAGERDPAVGSIAARKAGEALASLADLPEWLPSQFDVPEPAGRDGGRRVATVDYFPAETALAQRMARFPMFGLAAAAELPAPQPGAGSVLQSMEEFALVVDTGGDDGADPWALPQTGLWKAPTDILADGSSISLLEAGALPDEAVAVVEAIQVARRDELEARRHALAAVVVPASAGTAGLDSLEISYYSQTAAVSDLADYDSTGMAGAILAAADPALQWASRAATTDVAGIRDVDRADEGLAFGDFAGDMDPSLIAARSLPDEEVSSIVIAYAVAAPAWESSGMLTASLPSQSEPYARPSVLAGLDVVQGRYFENETAEVVVPGLANAVSRPIDAIAVARAVDREAPTDGKRSADGVRLAVLDDGVHDDGPVDIGGGGTSHASIMTASASPAGGDAADDGAYSGDIVIRPAAQSLLGEDLAGGGMPAVATVPGDVRSLRGAVALALETNPEIGQASANRQAIEFELAQGRGNYLPSVDLEARAGVAVTDNPTTRANGDDDRAFAPVEGRITVTQLLFDGFATDAEVERQASRVDGASYRVWERSEFIALNVIRAHQDINRLVQILGLAQQNLVFHRKVLDDISTGTRAGAISIADRQQAEERIISAQAFITDTREQLEAARITFNRLVGQFPGKTTFAPPVASHLPPSLNHAIGTARANNPTVKIADAAISTAYAETRAAEAAYLPTVNLELIGRAGEDLDGVRGRDAELRAMLVLRWNLYQGGVKPARVQERIRRIDEERMNLHIAQRDAEETMRVSWDRWVKQRERLAQLEQQLEQSTRLLGSYQEQYRIGRRSLLDVLDTQNTRFGTEVAVVTARHAVRFAEYRILAAGGELLSTLGIEPPATAEAHARADANVPAVPEPEAFSRSVPSRP